MTNLPISDSLLNSSIVKRGNNASIHPEIRRREERFLSDPNIGRSKIRRVPRQKFLRKYQKTPDRAVSWARKRKFGGKSLMLPVEICGLFSEGERAVLSVIANAVKAGSFCDWPIDKIAAIAGVCRRTAQYAIQKASASKLLSVKSRPRPGSKNLTNVLRVVSDVWLKYLGEAKAALKLAIGCKTLHPTERPLTNTLQTRQNSTFSTKWLLPDLGLWKGSGGYD